MNNKALKTVDQELYINEIIHSKSFNSNVLKDSNVLKQLLKLVKREERKMQKIEDTIEMIEMKKGKEKNSLLRKKRDEQLYKTIGKNIKNTRKKYRVSSKIIAHLLGVSYQQYRKYEEGVNRISISSLLHLADYFDISVNYFIKEDKNDLFV